MRTIAVVGLLIFLVSCNEKIFTAGVDCTECYTTKDDSVDLIIDITINDKYTRVPWKLYREEFEKDLIDWIDTAYSSTATISVAVDQEYSVKVEYAYNKDTIYVIDGTKVKLKRVTDECDDDCWVIEKNRIDARLKFDLLE